MTTKSATRVATRPSALFPSGVFFSAGRSLAGVAALLMQISLILWPFAVRWARRSNEQSGKDRILAELSDQHRLDPYARTHKKFRQTA